MTDNLVYAFVAQLCCYLVFAWTLSGNSNRAVAIVAVRFAVGLPIAVASAYALARPFDPYIAPVAISAPIAWLAAGMLDPKVTTRRLWLYWVLGGTVLTLALNAVVLRSFLHAGPYPFG